MSPEANETEANWTEANWTEANWTEANWTEANWTEANWTEANWTEANWTEAQSPFAAPFIVDGATDTFLPIVAALDGFRFGFRTCVKNGFKFNFESGLTSHGPVNGLHRR